MSELGPVISEDRHICDAIFLGNLLPADRPANDWPEDSDLVARGGTRLQWFWGGDEELRFNLRRVLRGGSQAYQHGRDLIISRPFGYDDPNPYWYLYRFKSVLAAGMWLIFVRRSIRIRRGFEARRRRREESRKQLLQSMGIE